MTDIGKNIRALRVQKGMTQEQLAQLLFVTRQTISNYEMGRSKPDVEMILEIAQVMESDVNAVLYGPPDFQRRRSARRRLIVGAVCCLVLFCGYALLAPSAYQAAIRFRMQPFYLLRLVLLPCAMFSLGWTMMQAATYFLHAAAQKVVGKYLVPLRIILLVILVCIGLFVIPFSVWTASTWVQEWSGTTFDAAFPIIPVYSQMVNFFVLALLRFPYLIIPLGVAFGWAGSSLRLPRA